MWKGLLVWVIYSYDKWNLTLKRCPTGRLSPSLSPSTGHGGEGGLCFVIISLELGVLNEGNLQPQGWKASQEHPWLGMRWQHHSTSLFPPSVPFCHLYKMYKRNCIKEMQKKRQKQFFFLNSSILVCQVLEHLKPLPHPPHHCSVLSLVQGCPSYLWLQVQHHLKSLFYWGIVQIILAYVWAWGRGLSLLITDIGGPSPNFWVV